MPYLKTTIALWVTLFVLALGAAWVDREWWDDLAWAVKRAAKWASILTGAAVLLGELWKWAAA